MRRMERAGHCKAKRTRARVRCTRRKVWMDRHSRAKDGTGDKNRHGRLEDTFALDRADAPRQGSGNLAKRGDRQGSGGTTMIAANITSTERLHAALIAALERYDDRVEEPFAATPSLRVHDRSDFYARVYPLADGLGIDASTGVVEHLEQIWDKALALSDTMPPERKIELLGRPSHVVDMSLRWLMQHELNHFAIGHFKVTGAAGLLEAATTSRSADEAVESHTTAPGLHVSPEDQALAPLCLELQADYDATEIVLGAYSPQNWDLFRYYAICIVAVILIIEREERLHSSPSETHPKAATRLFMLLAYLTELPFIPAYKRAHREGLEVLPESYLPPAHEIEGFRNDVVEPVFATSQLLAEATDVPTVWNDLGGADALFDDIETVLANGHDEPGAFRTEAAKQWAKLKPTNDRLLKIIWG